MKSAVVLSLLSGVLALPAPAAPTLKRTRMGKKHTLTRSDGTADVPAMFSSLNHTLGKWGAEPLPFYAPVAQRQAEQAEQAEQAAEARRAKLARRQANLPLEEQYENEDGVTEDVAYYGPVTIGAGDGTSQTFELIFDTGSADLWVPGPDCGLLKGCVHSTRYDQGGTDLQTTTSIQYGSGATEGENFVDDVTVAGLTSTNQTLISVTTASGFTRIDADGIAGMGFSAIAQDGGTTFFESLVEQGTVDTAEFGFYLGRVASGTEEDSELTLGGRDSTKFTGDFTTVPVTSQTYWEVSIDSISVDGEVAGRSTSGEAAIDTGTTVFLAPTTAARQIMNKIPNSYGVPLEGEIIYLFPCNTSASYIPSVTFAGVDFAINPLDFNIGSLSGEDIDLLVLGDQTLASQVRAHAALEDMCIAGFFGGDIETASGNIYIVGDTFIKNWYTVMSYTANSGEPAVLFAPSIGQ